MEVIFAILFMVTNNMAWTSGQQIFRPDNNIFPPLPPPHMPNLQNCKWATAKNLTRSGVIELPQHKYQSMEQCVYYFLRDKALKSRKNLSERPPRAGKGEVIITIKDAVLREFNVIEEYKHTDIAGYVVMSWVDERLQWPSDQFSAEEIRIQSMGDIWVPDAMSGIGIMPIYSPTSRSAHMHFANIRVNRNGTVVAEGQFYDHDIPSCRFDYKKYPKDDIECCVYFSSQVFAGELKFMVDKKTGHMDKQWLTRSWSIKLFTVETEFEEADPQDSVLKMCIFATRSSSTIILETTFPMILCAIVMLIAPIFKSIKLQLYVKLFSLMLQFMCFELLLSKTPHLGFGNEMPVVYQFYEFTLACTVVSLIINVVFYALIDCAPKLPPPHSMVLLASAVDRYLCCGRYSNDVHDPEISHASSNGNAIGADTPPKASGGDWKKICYAWNNLLSLLMIVIYVIGVIVEYAKM